jgi:tRNA pseudouridine55 synthase
VDLKPSTVHIYDIELLEQPQRLGVDGTSVTDVKVRVECSSGTYIRSIARDLGQKLGCGGIATHLIRSKVGEFSLDEAGSVAEAKIFELPETLPLPKHRAKR